MSYPHHTIQDRGYLVMRLDRVTIVNFRSIKDLTLKFISRCRILVGINEAGKTNILRALSLLSPESEIDADDVRVPTPNEDWDQEAYVRFVFHLEAEDRTAIYKNICNRILALNPREPLIATGNKKQNLLDLCSSVVEGLFNVNIKTKKRHGCYWEFPSSHQLTKGWYEPSPDSPNNASITMDDGTAKPITSFTLIHESVVENEILSHLSEASVSSVHAVLGKAITEYVESNLPECILWCHSDKYLIPARIKLNAFAVNPQTCVPLKHAFTLAGIQNTLEEYKKAEERSNGVRNLLDRVGKAATKHIHKVWPEYKDIAIDFRQNGEYLETSISDVHNLYHFSRRSDGFKRFVTFLLMISAPTKTKSLTNVLILNDDPDAGMHPKGIRHVRDELIRIARNNYVVYATHSIFMIDSEHMSRHLIVEKKKEITSVKEVNDSTVVDEEVLYNALGFSFAEILKPENLVFEGWRDKRLFETALSRVPKDYTQIKSALKNIGRCHVQGVKDVRRVSPLLELAGRGCIIISDGDKVARQKQAEHRREKLYGLWLRYDEVLEKKFTPVTAEDFIVPERFKEVVALTSKEMKADRLTSIGHFDCSTHHGVLNALNSWLSQAQLGSDEKKKFIEEIKENLFTNLKPSHIRREYYEFLLELVKK